MLTTLGMPERIQAPVGKMIRKLTERKPAGKMYEYYDEDGNLIPPPKVHDALNLSGLLNVLDGVVDTPGRIVVMTANHPEKLD